jgi:tetratricopeptide (TPR) repeat protein
VDYKLNFGLTNKETKLTPEQIAEYLKDVDLSKKLNPSDPLAYFITGILNGLIKNYQSALDAYNKAIQLDPGFALAYFNRANTRLQMIEDLKEQESLPVVISFGNNLQQPYFSTKTPLPDYKDVIDDYNKVITLNPDFRFAWFYRANIKAKLADYEGAVQDYSKAIELEPNLAQLITISAHLDLST